MLNIGVVGCGYWGPNLIRNFHSLENCNVSKVCDLSEARLKHINNLYPSITTTSEIKDVIDSKEIDAVAIATPVATHYEVAKSVLQKGKHVLIEKPMAASSDQCLDLLELSEKKKLVLMVGHTFIYSAPVRKIKEIVKSKDIGDLLYISSRRLNLGLFQKDINVTWDLAPHDISIILYVMGESPISVNCQGKSHVHKDVEDITNMTLNFSNGGFATIQSSWLDPNKIRDMTFVGDKRMLLYDDIEQNEKIKIYDKRVETPPHYDTFAEFHYSYHYGDIYSPYIKQTEPLKLETQEFIDAINQDRKPLTSGYDGLEVVKILEASTKSLSNHGGAVEIVNGRI